MGIVNFFKNTTWLSVFWGAIGGVTLIITMQLTTNGPSHLLPYPIVLIVAILSSAIYNKASFSFSKLFKIGLFTFMIMTFFLYVFIVFYINPNSGISFLGHFLRLTFMLLIGVLSSSIVSFIVTKTVK